MALGDNKLYVLVIYANEQSTIQTSIKGEVWYVRITVVNVLRTLLYLISIFDQKLRKHIGTKTESNGEHVIENHNLCSTKIYYQE